MAVPAPDGDSFNRFVISVGSASVALGLLSPWLLLREDASLFRSEAEISALTPSARDTVLDRQQLLAAVQAVTPWASFALVTAGVILLSWGGYRLFHLQKIDDEVAKAHLKIVQSESARIAEQPKERVEARRQAEVADELGDAESSSVSRAEDDPPGAPGRHSPFVARRAFMDRLRTAEEAVVERLSSTVGENGKLVPHARVAAPDGRLSFQSDAILTWQLNDVTTGHLVVEVKLLRPESATKSLLNRLREFAGTMFVARDILGLSTNGLIVLVVDDGEDELPDRLLEDLARRSRADAPSGIEVEVVRYSSIEDWTPAYRTPGAFSAE